VTHFGPHCLAAFRRVLGQAVQKAAAGPKCPSRRLGAFTVSVWSTVIALLLPAVGRAQPPLPACPSTGVKDSCVGATKVFGSTYLGEFRDDKFHGRGVYIFPSGGRYVGFFRNGILDGEAIEYGPSGVVLSSGTWRGYRKVATHPLDPDRFPFNPTSVAAIGAGLRPGAVDAGASGRK